jgi:hypothetical protein
MQKTQLAPICSYFWITYRIYTTKKKKERNPRQPAGHIISSNVIEEVTRKFTDSTQRSMYEFLTSISQIKKEAKYDISPGPNQRINQRISAEYLVPSSLALLAYRQSPQVYSEINKKKPGGNFHARSRSHLSAGGVLHRLQIWILSSQLSYFASNNS